MPTLREMVWPILAITLAATVLILLLAPLDATVWAEGFRGGISAEVGEGFESGAPGDITAIIGPLIKITFLMGIPALLTLGVRNLLGRRQKR